ncbi:MAG TPA: hemerythrin domain-containing protein [Gemmatimonadota bacterium]|nr:hemerythrin domain-containing protein [Gemmatimonadota bacterium]
MNAAHIHLMLNHVPLFGALAVTILFAVGLYRRQQGLARGGLVVALLTAIVGVVVYLTGEPAEELVENLPGVSEAVLETHEEIALIATIVSGAYGVLALVGLFAFRHGVTMRFTRVLLLSSLVPLGAMAYTSYLGGQIRHSEIRPDAGATGAGEIQEEEEENALRLGPLSPSNAFAALADRRLSASDTVDLIPPSIREEHASLRRALDEGSREPGAIGDAVRALAARMEPHFVKEEGLALPPLGVLPALATGEAIADPNRIVNIATRLESELPTMLEEHRAIGEAVEALLAAAEAEDRPDMAELGEQILHHARSEEEVSYPAAIIVGRYLKSRTAP